MNKNIDTHDENEKLQVLEYLDNVADDFSHNFSSGETPIHPNDIFVSRNRRRWEEEKEVKRRAISKKFKILLICMCGMLIVVGTFYGVKKMQSELQERKWEEQVHKSYQCLEELGEYSFFIPDMDYFFELYETSSKYEKDSKDYFSRKKQPEGVDEGKMHQFKVAGRMKNDFYPAGLMTDSTSGFASFSSSEFYLVNPNSTYIKNLEAANSITTLLVKIPEENKISAREEMKKYGRFEELAMQKLHHRR